MSAKKTASEGRLPEALVLRLSMWVVARPENVELWSCLRSPSNPPVAVSPAIYFSPASIGSSASSAARHCLLHRRCLVRQCQCRVPQQNLGRALDRSPSLVRYMVFGGQAQTAAVHPWNLPLEVGLHLPSTGMRRQISTESDASERSLGTKCAAKRAVQDAAVQQSGGSKSKPVRTNGMSAAATTDLST